MRRYRGCRSCFQKQFQSTHPLRGATLFWTLLLLRFSLFQSTHPLRGATAEIRVKLSDEMISIHAPLAGCDVDDTRFATSRRDFNPRTPCGVRPLRQRHHLPQKRFQSTHPLRGATSSAHPNTTTLIDFNPRTPCGVRPEVRCLRPCPSRFQSTHPLRGATALLRRCRCR